MVTVFLSVISPEAQVLVAILIAIVNLFLHYYYSPFYTTILNTMEVSSLSVSIITMYCGMYYITGSHYTYIDNNGLKWFFLVCLVIPNLFFFAYWAYHMSVEILKEAHKRGRMIFKIVSFASLDFDKF